MGKMFGILVIIVGLWAGGEIYTKGAGNAFGGLLVDVGIAEAPPDDAEPRTTGQRVGSKVGDVHSDADARRNRMLAD
jgi:Na+/H+-translocating membrane pyrophosphatase